MQFYPKRISPVQRLGFLVALIAVFAINAAAQTRDSLPPHNRFHHFGDRGRNEKLDSAIAGQLDSLFKGFHFHDSLPPIGDNDTLPPFGGGHDTLPPPPHGGGHDTLHIGSNDTIGVGKWHRGSHIDTNLIGFLDSLLKNDTGRIFHGDSSFIGFREHNEDGRWDTLPHHGGDDTLPPPPPPGGGRDSVGHHGDDDTLPPHNGGWDTLPPPPPPGGGRDSLGHHHHGDDDTLPPPPGGGLDTTKHEALSSNGSGIGKGMNVSSAVTADLTQNYPNPFYGTTMISFTLSSPDRVMLTVYGMNGEKIATLLDGAQKDAGTYSVSFNSGSLRSGTYVYRLQTSAGTIVKTMAVLR